MAGRHALAGDSGPNQRCGWPTARLEAGCAAAVAGPETFGREAPLGQRLLDEANVCVKSTDSQFAVDPIDCEDDETINSIFISHTHIRFMGQLLAQGAAPGNEETRPR